MYDPDPPRAALRLDAPRKAEQPTRQADAQHLARLERFERGTALVFRADGTVERLRQISEADRRLAQHIERL